MNHSTGSYKWLAVGVFSGIIVAEFLSRHMSPTLSWWIGGALIGVLPAGTEQPRSVARIALTAAATACVAALAHWAASTLS